MKKKKLLIICPHQVGRAPGQRLRYEQYFSFIEDKGYKITTSPFNSSRFQDILYLKGKFVEKVFWLVIGYFKRFLTIFTLPFYDCVYVFLWVVPDGTSIMERLFRLFSKKVIYDIDDLVFLNKPSEHNPLVRYIRSSNNYLYMMKCADSVIVNTPYLNTYVSQYASNVVDIPISINTKSHVPINSYANEDKVIIGWTGSHSTFQYFMLLENVLKRLAETHSFKVLVMCDEVELFIEGVDCELVIWRKDHEIAQIQRMDIGLYPLPNEKWVLGKGGGKALQYMSLGIPTVATDIGINNKIISEAESGFLVPLGAEDIWVKRLAQLIENEDLRKRLGQNARLKIEKEYATDVNKKKYVHLLNDLTNS